jgi:hypothetical protein
MPQNNLKNIIKVLICISAVLIQGPVNSATKTGVLPDEIAPAL